MLQFLKMKTLFLKNRKLKETYKISSIYNHEKIVNLFNNANTLSKIDLVFNYDNLISKGYNKSFLQVYKQC